MFQFIFFLFHCIFIIMFQSDCAQREMSSCGSQNAERRQHAPVRQYTGATHIYKSCRDAPYHGLKSKMVCNSGTSQESSSRSTPATADNTSLEDYHSVWNGRENEDARHNLSHICQLNKNLFFVQWWTQYHLNIAVLEICVMGIQMIVALDIDFSIQQSCRRRIPPRGFLPDG